MSRVAGTLPGQAGSRKDLQVPGAGPETARVARRLGVLPGAPGRRAGGRLSLLAAAFPLLQPPETPSLSVGGAAADRKSLTGEGTFQPSMVRRARVPQLEHGESGSQDDLRADLRRPWTSNLPPAVCPSHSQQEGSSAPPRPFRAAPHASDTQAGLPITQVDWAPGAADGQTPVVWPTTDRVFPASECPKELPLLSARSGHWGALSATAVLPLAHGMRSPWNKRV